MEKAVDFQNGTYTRRSIRWESDLGWREGQDLFCGFHYYFRNALNDKDRGDPHTDLEAPKIPAKVEQK